MGGCNEFGNRKIQIFASDIDNDALETARKGIYPEASFDAMPKKYIDEYFEKTPVGYCVKKIIREKIVFSYHNVVQDPPFLNLDLISCRNLLIYFQSALQNQVLARFHYALKPNGLLFLGKSEATSANERLFRALDRESHLFHRRQVESSTPINELVRAPSDFRGRVARSDADAMLERATVDFTRFESLIKVIGPDGLLVTPEQMVVQAFGDVSRYVVLHAGPVNSSVSSLIRKPFDQDIRTSIPIVLRKGEMRECLARKLDEDGKVWARAIVYPLAEKDNPQGMALVLFKSWTEPNQPRGEDHSDDKLDLQQQNDELRRELLIAHTNLQQTVEELETSNEELQSLNEEFQSSNEELQSTNEELETSNEELQSANEELSTVNEQLQVSSQSLRGLNQNLSSILLNIGTPLIVVDRGMTVTHVSTSAARVFDIDTTQPIPHLSMLKTPSGFPDLVGIVAQAMATLEPKETLINLVELHANLRVVPNFRAGEEVQGAIILLMDNTEELKRITSQLELIFGAIPQAMLVRNTSGEIVKANQAAAELVGKPLEEIEGAPFRELCEGEYADRVLEQDLGILVNDQTVLDEIEHIRFWDDREMWLRVSRVPYRDPTTNEAFVYSCNQDVTEQHLANEALKLSEYRLDLAIEASRIGLWDWDLKRETLWRSNRFNEILGVDNEQADKDHREFFDRLHPEDRQRVMSAFDNHLTGETPYNLTYRLQRTDGEYVWIEARGRAIRDDDGTPSRFIGTAEDITESKANLLALRERSHQLELAAKMAGIGYWKINLTENTLFWSDQIYRIHGLSPDEYHPDLVSAIEFYHPDDIDFVKQTVERAIERAEPFEFEARIIRPSGEIRTVGSVCVVDTGFDEKAHSVFGAFVDLTDQKQQEAELRATMDNLSRSNEELSRFSYVCSHDMKEPVRLIDSICSLLTDQDYLPDDESRADLLNRIQVNTKRLGAIIDGLLAFSRIEGRIEFAPLELNKIVDDICDSLTLLIAEKNAVVERGDLPIVNGATVHMTQLFQNLITNALKFSDKEKPVIRITSNRDNDLYQFLVEDNGPGINNANRTEVFQLFKRLKRRDEVDGSGLGLSICKKIVEQYGGTISVGSSQRLGGACFDFTIKAPID